ncbi:MAG: hypothetical protein AABY11_02825, partial [archaeon]
MRLALFFGFSILLLAGLSPLVVGATTSAFTWGVVGDYYLDAQLYAERCPAALGMYDLNAVVYQRPSNTPSTTSTVTGTIYRPLGGTDAVTFTNNGDGNYVKVYDFNQSGTYKIVLNASDVNFASADVNEYVYIGDVDFQISFLNNSFEVAAGNTGTIQNLVKNSDNNAITGITGSIDINYPSGTVFTNDGNISETGNGQYYYTFTAPSVAGVYTAASSFTCGTNTDVNMGGRFTVTVTSSGGGTSEDDSVSENVGFSGGGGGGGAAATKPYASIVQEWGFSDPIEVGTSNRIFAVIKNTGTLGTRFLVKATISSAQKNEYFDTFLTDFIPSKGSTSITFDEPYTTYTSGNHLINIQLFKPDGSEKIGEFAQSFDVGGILRYDVVATCLEPNTIPGKDVSALINLINLGDYFQDMQFEWWVEGKNGEKVGAGTFPIALYNQESRSLVRSVHIPEGFPAGEYQFRAQLSYETTLIEGACSFNVKITKEYYEDELSYFQTVLKELEKIAETKRAKLSPETFERISEIK